MQNNVYYADTEAGHKEEAYGSYFFGPQHCESRVFRMGRWNLANKIIFVSRFSTLLFLDGGEGVLFFPARKPWPWLFISLKFFTFVFPTNHYKYLLMSQYCSYLYAKKKRKKSNGPQ